MHFVDKGGDILFDHGLDCVNAGQAGRAFQDSSEPRTGGGDGTLDFFRNETDRVAALKELFARGYRKSQMKI